MRSRDARWGICICILAQCIIRRTAPHFQRLDVIKVEFLLHLLTFYPFLLLQLVGFQLQHYVHAFEPFVVVIRRDSRNFFLPCLPFKPSFPFFLFLSFLLFCFSSFLSSLFRFLLPSYHRTIPVHGMHNRKRRPQPIVGLPAVGN